MVGYPNRFADSGGGGVSLGYADGGRFRKGGQAADDMEMTGLLGYQTVDGDHGRVETRTYDVIGGADWLDPQGKWGGLVSAEEFGKASRNHATHCRSIVIQKNFVLTSDNKYYVALRKKKLIKVGSNKKMPRHFEDIRHHQAGGANRVGVGHG